MCTECRSPVECDPGGCRNSSPKEKMVPVSLVAAEPPMPLRIPMSMHTPPPLLVQQRRLSKKRKRCGSDKNLSIASVCSIQDRPFKHSRYNVSTNSNAGRNGVRVLMIN